MKRVSSGALVVSLAILGLSVPTAPADDIADFYSSDRLTMLVGSSAGDSTYQYGRLPAKYIVRKLWPDAQFLSTQLPGCNGLPAQGSSLG